MVRGGNIFLIGDVHGKLDAYLSLLAYLGDKPSIQLGDMSFGYDKGWLQLPKLPLQHRFIPGNHDHPRLCIEHPACLGKFGYLERPRIFFVGGGYSIDRDDRILGKSWWLEEELNATEANTCYDLYCRTKPAIVISHECPTEVASLMYAKYGGFDVKGSTGTLLQNMFEERAPELWIFGHHHKNWQRQVRNTYFCCLDELRVAEVRVTGESGNYSPSDVFLHL